MARTITEIYNSMIVVKEETAELDGLTSNSKVAVWRLILYICAVSMKIVEDLFDLAKEFLEIRSEELIAGSLRWYAAESLVYQFGDELVYNSETGQYGYLIEDETKQVVELSAAVDDSAGQVFVKAAKINDSTGIGEPLSAPELSGLTAYWDLKKFAGTNLTVSSDPADKLQVGYRIRYDGRILSSTGELLSEAGVFPVEDAINQMLIEFTTESFNGLFQLEEMTNAIQEARGVSNATPTLATARSDDDLSVFDILADPDQIYSVIAGYMVVDPAYPLASNLVYVAL